MSIDIGHYCGQELANMILHSQNGCNRHDPAVSTRIILLFYHLSESLSRLARIKQINSGYK